MQVVSFRFSFVLSGNKAIWSINMRNIFYIEQLLHQLPVAFHTLKHHLRATCLVLLVKNLFRFHLARRTSKGVIFFWCFFFHDVCVIRKKAPCKSFLVKRKLTFAYQVLIA